MKYSLEFLVASLHSPYLIHVFINVILHKTSEAFRTKSMLFLVFLEFKSLLGIVRQRNLDYNCNLQCFPESVGVVLEY